MKKSKFVKVILLVIISIFMFLGIIYGVLMNLKEDVEYDLVYECRIDTKEFKKEHFYDYDRISAEELKEWGIDISDIEQEDGNMLCYTIGHKFTRIWNYKYEPQLFFNKEPSVLSIENENAKEDYIYIYLVNVKDIDVYNFFGWF